MGTSTQPRRGDVNEACWHAMGTTAHVVVVGDAALLEVAWTRVAELERRWSRFREDSEVSALNRHSGAPVLVSDDTLVLLQRALAAWNLTEGRFDPTVGDALVSHGYDRDFNELAALREETPAARPAPGLAGLELDPVVAAATLPAGARFDPGGIGKGLAADLVAGALLEAGASGALVNLGGDLRAVGQPPASEGWVISVDDPAQAQRELVRLALGDGAVATSSRLRRRWRTAGGEAHHLIDPATGTPAVTDVVAVTVVAGEAWTAEAISKDLVLSGPSGFARYPHAHALIVAADGHCVATEQFARLLP
jgi:thiamine biosynthesis lipoprotein